MRLVIPEPFGFRGIGLGNELFPWAKAFLASRVLGGRLFHPAWGLNPRRYHEAFGTSRLDWLGRYLLKSMLPVVRFDEAMYRSTGKSDFEEALIEFAEWEGLIERRNYVFSVGGMWGGFLAIRKARSFVMAELLKARNTIENVHEVMRQVDLKSLLVAVHIRRGDFKDVYNIESYQGKFNIAVPLEWYIATCLTLKKSFGLDVQFLMLTDACEEEIKKFIDIFTPITTFHLSQTPCSDLLLMAMADCLICSISSYSMWGAFLSDAPYFWFARNLQLHGNYGSLWGHEDAQRGNGETARNLRWACSVDAGGTEDIGRGIPVDLNGEIPSSVIDMLHSKVRLRTLQRDLLYYGIAKLPPCEQGSL